MTLQKLANNVYSALDGRFLASFQRNNRSDRDGYTVLVKEKNTHGRTMWLRLLDVDARPVNAIKAIIYSRLGREPRKSCQPRVNIEETP